MAHLSHAGLAFLAHPVVVNEHADGQVATERFNERLHVGCLFFAALELFQALLQRLQFQEPLHDVVGVGLHHTPPSQEQCHAFEEEL